MAKVEQYDAIDFFDFCEISSDEVTEACFQWRSLILSLVLQEDPAQLKRLVVSWDESKRTRQKYWEENFGVMDTATGITALRESLTAFEQEKSCVWRRLITVVTETEPGQERGQRQDRRLQEADKLFQHLELSLGANF